MNDKRPLNILFLTSWYPTDNNPTLGNFIRSHAEASALYNKVDVVYVSKSEVLDNIFEIENKQFYQLSEHIVKFKKPTHKIHIINRLITYYRYIKAYQIVLSKLNQKPDIIHLNIIYPVGLLAIWLKWFWHIPLVYTENWSIYQPENRHQIKKFRRYAFKLIIQQSDCILPVSQQLANEMIQFKKFKAYRIIPNTINTSIFTFNPKTLSNEFRFLHVSTAVDEVKNVSGILNAFSELLKIDAQNHLSIVTDGQLEPHQKHAADLKISPDKISFIGQQTALQVAQWMHHSHVFVLFSNYENLPLVMIESFATGTPVIASNVGGIAEHFSDEFGYLVEKQDEKALLQAMLDTKANYSKFNFEQISAYSNTHFSQNAVGKQFTEVYHALIKG